MELLKFYKNLAVELQKHQGEINQFLSDFTSNELYFEMNKEILRLLKKFSYKDSHVNMLIQISLFLLQRGNLSPFLLTNSFKNIDSVEVLNELTLILSIFSLLELHDFIDVYIEDSSNEALFKGLENMLKTPLGNEKNLITPILPRTSLAEPIRLTYNNKIDLNRSIQRALNDLGRNELKPNSSLNDFLEGLPININIDDLVIINGKMSNNLNLNIPSLTIFNNYNSENIYIIRSILIYKFAKLSEFINTDYKTPEEFLKQQSELITPLFKDYLDGLDYFIEDFDNNFENASGQYSYLKDLISSLEKRLI